MMGWFMHLVLCYTLSLRLVPDEEALDLVLEEEARESRAHEEWLEKCRQQEEEDAKYEIQLLGFHGTI
ncbi:hypothetical protein Tco_1558803 [Tanacetum coccineum]